LPLLDAYGHMVVDHDLDDIAEGFLDFGRRQHFGFLAEG